MNELEHTNLVQGLEKYIELKHTATIEELEEYLTAEIVYMLQYELEKLLSLLYRIDVKEQKVKAAFAQNDSKKIAPLLAKEIIIRELQKIETRKQFK